ncbi:MAG TPA: hypothetical protein V6C69_21770 [Trichormus sp.]|jgi:hypothetical protein
MHHNDHGGGRGHGWGGGTEVSINFGGGYETPMYEPSSMYNDAYGGCYGGNYYNNFNNYNNYNYNNFNSNYYNQWNQPQVCQPQDYLSMTPAPYPMYERPPVMYSQPIMAEPMYPIYPRGGLGIGFGGRHWHVGLFI